VVKDQQLVGIITRSDILDFVLSSDGRRNRPAPKARRAAGKAKKKRSDKATTKGTKSTK